MFKNLTVFWKLNDFNKNKFEYRWYIKINNNMNKIYVYCNTFMLL